MSAYPTLAEPAAPAGPGVGRQDPVERRRALYHLASPVSVLTVNDAGRLHGTTASTVTLVSREPLLLGVCLRSGSSFARLAARAGRFTVNVLAAEQADVARWFADSSRPDGAGQFASLACQPDPYTGAPLLAGALAHYVCRVHALAPLGDSEVLVGRVVRAGADEGSPLLSYTGGLYAARLNPAPTAKEIPSS